VRVVGKGRVWIIVWLLGVQADHVFPAPHELAPLQHDLLLGDHADTARVLYTSGDSMYLWGSMKVFGGRRILKSQSEAA
jgi:hypothetical protein